jgi:hypothetical protein
MKIKNLLPTVLIAFALSSVPVSAQIQSHKDNGIQDKTEVNREMK